MSRTRFVQQLVRNEIEPDGSVILSTGQGNSLIIAPDDVAAFIVVTLADMFEQWYSWQDDIYAQYPDFAPQSAQVHWAASLEPMRPTHCPSFCFLCWLVCVAVLSILVWQGACRISPYWPEHN